MRPSGVQQGSACRALRGSGADAAGPVTTLGREMGSLHMAVKQSAKNTFQSLTEEKSVPTCYPWQQGDCRTRLDQGEDQDNFCLPCVLSSVRGWSLRLPVMPKWHRQKRICQLG